MTRTETYLRFALLATTALSALPAGADELLPTGASVAHGSVGISTPAANAMTIQQSSPNAIVNWHGFSIGEGARVDIHQPSTSSAILNRVTSSTPSTIAGQLNANGQVYLLNPNGILIQKSGIVRTGAFVASTLAMTDEDFAAGRRDLFGNGRSAAVVNEGSIEVDRGGYAALVGGKVENSGTITALLGKIGLASAERATLDLSGDGFLQVAMPSEQDDDDGALVSNTGRLVADGGRIELKAATARQMARQVINLSGIVQARTVDGVSGDIQLGGGEGGRVRVSGRLDASAPARPEPLAAITPPPPRPERGGSIVVTGDAVELAGATLDASGPGGGGTILVGGDWQGGGTLPHSSLTSVDAATLISADAMLSSDGGTVVVWSDEHTVFDGRISARGGAAGGDGGLAEVSGKALLSFTGQVDLSAPAGSFGTLLLDPFNVFIEDGATSDGVDEDITDDVDPTITLTPTADDSIISAAEIEEALGGANVTIQTSLEGEGDQPGNITVNAPLSWTDPNELTLTTGLGAITINAPVATGDGGGLSTSTTGTTAVNAAISLGAGSTLDIASGEIILSAPITSVGVAAVSLDASGSPITVRDAITLGAGSTLDLDGVDIALNAPIIAGDRAVLSFTADDSPISVSSPITIGASASLSLSAGAGANLLLGSDITWGTASTVNLAAGNDITIPGSLSGPTGDLVIDASGTITSQGAVDVGTFILDSGDWSQVESTLPAFSAVDFRIDDSEGTDPTFLRALDGNGSPDAPYLIADVYGLQGIGSSLVIDDAFPDLADSYALANDIDAGVTSGWNDVEGAEGFDPIGDLFDGPTFQGSFQGNGFTIAGLFIFRPFESVGLFTSVGPDGSVDNVALTAAAITGGDVVGGLAGQNLGVISRVRMLPGTVTGVSPDETVDFSVGGLVGENFGAITQSFSTAAVTGLTRAGSTAPIGGLVGLNTGTVSDSHASGAVAGVGPGEPLLGGLVGQNDGEGRVIRTFATGSVTAAGAADGLAGGLVGQNAGLVDQSYAAGVVSGNAAVGLGGLVAGPPDETTAAPVFASFWDSIATGQTASAGGGTPLTTGAFQDTVGFMALAGAEGWDFETTWAPPSPGDPGFYPELYALTPVVRVDVDDASRLYGDPDPVFTSSNFGGPGAFVFGPPGDSVTIPFTTLATVTSAVGSYPITTGPSAPSAAGVIYRLATTDGTLAVDLRPLTITAENQTKTYGDLFPFAGTEFTTLPGQLVNGDTVDFVLLESVGALQTATVGSAPILASAAEGPRLSNYDIGFEPGVLTVTQRPLTITAENQTKTYGDLFPFAGTEFTTLPGQLVNGDTVDFVLLESVGALQTATVGSAPILASAAEGPRLSNYDIGFEPGVLTVTQRPLTITAENQTKTYGDLFPFAGTEFTTLPGQLVNGDTVDFVLLESVGALQTATVGSAPILASAAEGPRLSNYDIGFEPGVLTVNQRPLTITADNRIKIFGEEVVLAGTEFTTSGLVNGDRVTLVRLDSAGAPAGASLEDSPYDIIASEAQGSGPFSEDLLNYDISYEAGSLVVAEPPVEDFDAGLRLNFATGLPNPSDVIEIAATEGFEPASGGGGPTLGTGENAVASAQDALAFVQRLSTNLETRVDSCSPSLREVDPFLSCVSDALADYARELDARILDLPAPLRAVSAVIQQSARQIEGVRADAARRIAAATSDEEIRAIQREAAARAGAAVQAAVVEIRKAIELVRAEDDPELASLQVEQGTTITAALQNVEDELAQAVGL